jgi:hypothetical protein
MHYPIGYAPSWTEVDVRRWLQRVGTGVYEDLCRLERAHHQAYAPPHEREMRELSELEARAQSELAKKPPLTLTELAMNGRSLMERLGVKPGPELGTLLQQLLDLVVEQPELNRPDLLLERARALLASAANRGQ